MTLRTPNGPRFATRELPATDVGVFVAERFSTVAGARRGEAILHAPAETVAPWAGRYALVEAIDSGRCRVHAASWSWGGLAAWFAMFDVDFEIVGPPELRAAAGGLARRFAAVPGRPGRVRGDAECCGAGRECSQRLAPALNGRLVC